MKPGTITYIQVHYYGCTVCQKHHKKGEPLYGPHFYYQDKHGIKTYTESLVVKVVS